MAADLGVDWIERAASTDGFAKPYDEKVLMVPLKIQLREVDNSMAVVLSLPSAREENSTFVRINIIDVIRHMRLRSERGLIYPTDVQTEADRMLRRAEVLRREREFEQAKARLEAAIELEKNQGRLEPP
jgi:hypothetical protein